MSIWCNYTRAIVRQIPATLASAALRREQPSSPIDLAKARSQHDHYVEVLRGLVSQLVVLPADDSYPDCVFVEDPAVVCGNRAVVCNIGHESRRGEVSAIRDVLRDFGLTIADMTVDGSDDAKMDGGDVLFTGHEFFVGMSERTSQKGADFLAAAFPEYCVHTAVVRDALHLKSLVSMAGPELMTIADCPAGQHLWQQMSKTATKQYQVVWIPDQAAANCVYVNGTLIYRSSEEFPDSVKILQGLASHGIEVNNEELAKADGALTCGSLLIS
eukprot:m.221807 g.221807  ORF g.221807 m.221807 type:complete len:272 (+) comp39965_c0_seq16:1215-2030(+)